MTIKIKQFLEHERVEKFVNDFEENNKIIKREIKIVVVKGRIVFYLVLEY